MNPLFTPRIVLVAASLCFISGCDKIKDLPVGLGYTAKHLCSGVFVSGLDKTLVRDQFIAPKVQPLPWFWKIKIDEENKTVTVSDVVFLDSFTAKAVYREHIGCTLLAQKTESEALDIVRQKVTPVPVDPLPPGEWPHGRDGVTSNIPDGVDMEAIQQTVDAAFTENYPGPRNTTSFLVIYKGKLIAEKYALGVTAETPVLGWSMTKTVTGMLIGLLHERNVIDINAPAPIPEWQGTDKANITTTNILHMASGLDFNEGYEGLSDVSLMLYRRADMAGYAGSLPLTSAPGSTFNYATGDTLLLSRIVMNKVGGDLQSAYDFYQRELFHPLDIRSAFIEFDASGTFVGGAYGYMSPRDWARLGLFYLNRGEWNGQQILSKEWVDFAFTPSPAASYYGVQLWMNTDGSEWDELPEGIYHFSGHQGQEVLMVPERELVVVRTGVTEEDRDIGIEAFMQGILRALPAASP